MIFGHVEKAWLGQKDNFNFKKFNFKIYDVKTWLINTCNAHIDQYQENQKETGNEIWSVNRI